VKRLNLITEGTRPLPLPEASASRPAGEVIRLGPLELRFDINRAAWGTNTLDLTLTEFKIVALLALRTGEDVGYREIYDLVHGKDFVAGYGAEGYRANVRTFIKRIRKKFRDLDPEFDQIHNYAGFGYRWIAGA
jgi:two-component system, OmpR family, response regulator ChvI